MLYRKYFAAACSCFMISLLCLIIRTAIPEGNPAASLSPALLRFHILADGNDTASQNLKLEVRSLLLDLIYEGISTSGNTPTKETVQNYIDSHSRQLEQAAEDYMAACGRPAAARIEITNSYFPEKSYGSLTLPAGYYDAAQVTLGKGRGRNWWCVLYPSLCISQETYAVMPDESLNKLKSELPSALYQSVIRPRLKLMDVLTGHPSIPSSPDPAEHLEPPTHNPQ